MQLIQNKQILESFSKILSNKFLKDVGITFFENIATRFLNFFIILILTKILGPESYGKYSFIYVVMIFSAAFFDFGMDNTAIRFSSREKSLKNSIFGLYFLVKLLIMSILILSLIIGGKYIFHLIHKDSLTHFIPFLIIGLIGESLFLINDTFLLAIQQFKFRAIVNISRYFLSLLYVVILFLNKIVLLKYVFLVYVIPVLFSVIFIGRYIDFLWNYITKFIESDLLTEIFEYEKWMFSLSIATNILGRIDFLMLSFWVGFREIGIYNAALQLSSVVAFIPMVFNKVLLPKLSEKEPNDIIIFTKKMVKKMVFLVIFMICLIPFSGFLVPLLLGDKYNSAIGVLQYLLLGFTLAFITVPLDQALYSLGKPKFITVNKYIQIIIVILLNCALIPRFGMIWAAVNMVASRIIALILSYYAFNKIESQFKQV